MRMRIMGSLAVLLATATAGLVWAQVGFVPPPPVIVPPPVFAPPPLIPITPLLPPPPLNLPPSSGDPIGVSPGQRDDANRGAPAPSVGAPAGANDASADGGFIFFCVVLALVALGAIGFSAYSAVRARRSRAATGDGPLDPSWRPPADLILGVQQTGFKAIRCELILERLAERDPVMNSETLTAWVRDTFLRAQRAWQARDYRPVRARLAPALYEKHQAQLRTLRSYKEINRLDGLEIDRIEFVHLDYSSTERQFTALITFRASSWYVHDRTGAWTRGPREVRQFQQYWVFRRHEDAWRLEEIEQTRESDRLGRENFVEFPVPGA